MVKACYGNVSVPVSLVIKQNKQTLQKRRDNNGGIKEKQGNVKSQSKRKEANTVDFIFLLFAWIGEKYHNGGLT